jgi:hypothetical protein
MLWHVIIEWWPIDGIATVSDSARRFFSYCPVIFRCLTNAKPLTEIVHVRDACHI